MVYQSENDNTRYKRLDIDSLGDLMKRASDNFKLDSVDSQFGDTVAYDNNISRILSIDVPTDDWKYLTGLMHFIDYDTMPSKLSVKESFITVVPTARYIIDVLWNKIKFSRKYFNADGSLKSDRLKVLERWYVYLASDEAIRLWMDKYDKGDFVEICRTFNHETKEIKVYVGKQVDGKLVTFNHNTSESKNVLSVMDDSTIAYVCNDIQKSKSNRLQALPNNTSDRFVNSINNRCYSYGVGYLKSPLQTRGSRKINSIHISL